MRLPALVEPFLVRTELRRAHMTSRATLERFRCLCERLSDPALTALTFLLAVLLFVVGPLQIAGVVTRQWFGICFGLVLIPAALLVSRSTIAVVSILMSMALVVVAAVLELRDSVDL